MFKLMKLNYVRNCVKIPRITYATPSGMWAFYVYDRIIRYKMVNNRIHIFQVLCRWENLKKKWVAKEVQV